MNNEAEHTRFTIRLSEAKKEKWQSYVDENPEYASLADLIRTGVAHEMNTGHANQGTPESADTLRKMAEVVDAVDDLADRFNSVEKRLSSLESESRRDTELGELTTEVYQLLPDEKPGTRAWEEEHKNLTDQAQVEEHEEIQAMAKGWAGTIEELTEALDEREYRVEEALRKLMSDTTAVRTTDDGKYYRRD